LGLNEGIFIFGFNSQFNKTFNVFSSLIELVDRLYDLLQGHFFFAKGLRSVWLIPNVRTF
jgi:hypothetical protein